MPLSNVTCRGGGGSSHYVGHLTFPYPIMTQNIKVPIIQNVGQKTIHLVMCNDRPHKFITLLLNPIRVHSVVWVPRNKIIVKLPMESACPKTKENKLSNECFM